MTRTIFAQPVTLEVEEKLTDLDYKPLAGVPFRLTFGTEPDWQSASAGHRLVTNERGEAKFETKLTLDSRLQKLPTNFIDSLLSTPKRTTHLDVCAELEYAGHHWLYVADISVFPGNNDILLNGLTVYTRDDKGRFTRKAKQDDLGWHMPELGRMVLTTPGWEPWDYRLTPEENSASRWRLQIAFKRSPAPIIR